MKLDKFTCTSNIVLDIVFTLLTCGIYGLFWQARLFRTVNTLIGEQKYNFWPWFFLSIITCGIYNIYIQYVFGKSLSEGLAAEGGKSNESLSVLALVLTIFGLGIVVMAIEQNDINNFCEQNPA
jgi:Domain of unknown function (DUF4234)